MPPDFWTWLFANKAWSDFPVVFLLVAVFTIVGLAARWFWHDYKAEQARMREYTAIEAEKDRAFREAQDTKREQAQDKRDGQWRTTIQGQYALYNQYDRERQETLVKISTALEAVATKADLQEHDERAKGIAHVISRVEENTRPLPGQPGYERRHAGD
jgi:plasmid maintenance system killer protein